MALQYYVYRHAQDSRNNCGRACAQMVISALSLGPQNVNDTAAVPVTQQTLMAAENGLDPTIGVRFWHTTPIELVGLLNRWSETVKWKFVARKSRAELLAAIAESLDAGMPAIVNIFHTNHWVVVLDMQEKAGKVKELRYHDPLPTNLRAPHPHTYQDNCHDYQERGYSRIDPADAELQVEIEGVRRGVAWNGDYVAIVPEQVQDPEPMPAPEYAPGAPPEPAEAGDAAVKLELLSIAREKGVVTTTEPPVLVRTVKDVDTGMPTYVLASVFSEETSMGVIGRFTLGARLRDYRVTRDRGICDQLKKEPNEQLLWKSHGSHPWDVPYYPYCKGEQDGPRYRRFVDDEYLEEPPDES